MHPSLERRPPAGSWLRRALAGLRSRRGATLIEVIVIAGIVIIIVGGGMYYVISRNAAPPPAELETAAIRNYQAQIAYNGSGPVRVQGTFDKATINIDTLLVKLWDSDGFGSTNRDSLAAFTIVVPIGTSTFSAAHNLSCDAKGVLERDDDDGDHKYEVFAEVIQELGSNVAESNKVEISCVSQTTGE